MRADRLLAIMLLLQTRGKLTTSALAQELEVSRRTILRDVEALSMAGVPIYAEGGHGGGIALDEKYRTTLTGLTEAEVRSLFIASNTQLLGEVGLDQAAESLLRKLLAALPASHQPAVDHIRQRIYIDPVWWWHDGQPLPYWAELQEAVYQDRCIRVLYENYNGEIAERVLEPYSLVSKSSSWYLVAKRQGQLRTYRITRLRALTLLDTSFVRDPDFDLITYWHEHLAEFIAAFSEYECTLRVHPDRANFVRWLTPGRSQLLATDADGWTTVRLQLESAELAKMLVFGLGSQGEVIEPQGLKEEVLRACQEMLAGPMLGQQPLAST
jgi:predicted DNA-binding transcriptional regulator YafY